MENLKQKIKQFNTSRDWDQYHNPKDLSLSLCLEAAELLENFQWLTSEDAVDQNLDNIKDELADVFIYTLQIAMKLDLDLLELADMKMAKNALKYPLDK